MGAPEASSARVGYAVDEVGDGVVYARLVEPNGRTRVLKSPFHAAAADDRATGLAALTAITPRILRCTTAVDVYLDDRELIADLTEHRELPVGALLPYVRARCALNMFKACRLREAPGPNDLTARALAEVSMRIAA